MAMFPEDFEKEIDDIEFIDLDIPPEELEAWEKAMEKALEKSRDRLEKYIKEFYRARLLEEANKIIINKNLRETMIKEENFHIFLNKLYKDEKKGKK